MKTIIIECNPSKNSFGESIKEKIISVLEGKKKEYHIIELYKDNFNPVMSEEDEKLYKIEKNVNQSTNEITIKKISESNGKIIYEMKTNFAQNSKDKKWDFLLELINRYKT